MAAAKASGDTILGSTEIDTEFVEVFRTFTPLHTPRVK